MYSANDIVEMYVQFWKETSGRYNSNPTRIRLNLDLKSARKFFSSDYQERLHRTLDDLNSNSLRAISGIDEWPEKLMKIWIPEEPGTITYRTKDIGDLVRIEVEDNGCGINPEEIKKFARQRFIHLRDKTEDYGVINSVFLDGLSTKERSFGHGLAIAKKAVNSAGGQIYVAGTCYNDRSVIERIGDHPGKNTGTIMRMDFLYEPIVGI
jgi:signal transduction histidine kinase